MGAVVGLAERGWYRDSVGDVRLLAGSLPGYPAVPLPDLSPSRGFAPKLRRLPQNPNVV